MAARHGARAIVLGSSIGGAAAAGAVAPYFDEVLIIERDDLPEGTEHRKGAPQGQHPHFLLNNGRRAIGELYPGIEDELVGLGAVVRNAALETAYCEVNGWTPRTTGDMTMLYSSRVLLERGLRDRAKALPNATIHERAQVVGLVTERGGTAQGRVTAVRWRDADGVEHTTEADLIVDAMGRGSSVATWLSDAGWAAPREMTLDAKAVYSSRWYELPKDESDRPDWWWSHLAILPTPETGNHPPEHEYLCTIFPIEDDKRIVFMGSWGLDMPKTNVAFEAAAERTRTPYFANSIKRLEPTSDVHVTRSTGNKWRRYDEMPHPPLGLVVIGDAVCAFNPLYGQGMSSAARSSVILRDNLATATAIDAGFHRAFLTEQREFITIPWSLAVARDQGYDHAVGTELAPKWKRRIAMKLAWPLMSLISSAGRENRLIEENFTRVFNIEQSLGDMMTNPRVLYGLARYQLLSMLGRTKLPKGFGLIAEPPAEFYDHLIGKA